MSKKTNQHKHFTQAEHHLSARQRLGHLDFSFIDHLVLFTGPLIPIAVFTQAYKVWSQESADGLSLITWLVLLFSSSVMAAYALKHRTKPLIITYIPLVLANILVVVGILRF